MPDYELFRFSLPADLEELFTAELWSFGAWGFEIREAEAGRVRLDAYFPTMSGPAVSDRALARWTRRGVLAIGSESLTERDWLAPYREAAEPFDIGKRFRVDPRDPSEAGGRDATSDARITLKIPAQTAFGTGSHTSTRLVLEWLEDLKLAGLAVLDVGTGSGILSFAAGCLGAGATVAFDVDGPAVCVARGNARLNVPLAHLQGADMPRFFAGSLAALADQRRFDLALVNILPENFAGEIPSLVRVLKQGGRVISSGNLAERRDELLSRWRRRGFELEAERHGDEWVAFLLTLQR